jgi:hypothetical protein
MKWSRAHLSAAMAAQTAHAGHSARNIVRGDTAVIVHSRSPPSHVDQSSLSRVWASPEEPRSTSSLLTTTLPSSPLLSCRRSACCGQPPQSRSHHHPSRGKGSPSSPLPLAPSWSSSHQSSTLGGRVHRAAFFFSAGRYRPPCFNLLRANRPYHELPLYPLLLTDPRIRSDSLSSTPPMIASLSSSSSPSVECLGEPLYVKLVPIESLGARLSPRHHLARPLATG